ncbi:hypothetical protein SYNTR_1825 [Candidatus Syntrophocurvum alkaliphilum]|uniref:Uncharacterized protein n=1 Tax=Candidatus Syntrophocurvum alkaliphilum TaxID=2293317 RepID=A0A6I6DI38_9FIRM|nr:hypothetical protein SYNTR_1825 [Candidatus Syntrophocurvum alkaliphilum]
MKIVRKVANSDVLASIIDIPDELKNKKVEIIILPYENIENADIKKQHSKKVRGVLGSYKNEKLQSKEKGAFMNAMVEE